MHELSITRSILGIVKREMKKNRVSRLKSVKIKVGELTAVEPEVLRFCFDACVKGTPIEGAVLDIEEVPLTGRCSGCSKEFRSGFESVCPACRGPLKRVAGAELDVVSMEAY